MRKATYTKPLCAIVQMQATAIMAGSPTDFTITGTTIDEDGEEQNSFTFGGDTEAGKHYDVW